MKKRQNRKNAPQKMNAENGFTPNPYDPLGSWNGNPLLNPIMPFEGADEAPTQDVDDL